MTTGRVMLGVGSTVVATSARTETTTLVTTHNTGHRLLPTKQGHPTHPALSACPYHRVLHLAYLHPIHGIVPSHSPHKVTSSHPVHPALLTSSPCTILQLTRPSRLVWPGNPTTCNSSTKSKCNNTDSWGKTCSSCIYLRGKCPSCSLSILQHRMSPRLTSTTLQTPPATMITLVLLMLLGTGSRILSRTCNNKARRTSIVCARTTCNNHNNQAQVPLPTSPYPWSRPLCP